MNFEAALPPKPVPRMLNLLEQAISADNGELAAKIIQDALGVESDGASP